MKDLPDIAVVGMSCTFPGAKDLDAYWNNITNKVSAITTAPEHRIGGVHFDPSSTAIDKHYTNQGGFIDQYLDFDPMAFGIVPNTISETEPEQFISLKLSHQALEDAGVFDKNISLERSGIVIGKGNYGGTVVSRLIETVSGIQRFKKMLQVARPDFSNHDLDRILASYQSELGNFGPHNVIGNTPSLVASIVANRFNFSGPAYTVDAACASSLIAIDHCVRELQLGRSDLMVAGAIHIYQTPMLWSVFCTLGAFSKTSLVRPFDKKADGVLAGEGCGFLVLRRLEDAVKDDQRIYAVIKGVGISSDGSHASLMSPAWQGQTKAIKQAWDQTSLRYDQIGYVEAHGTATVLGDKTELKSLSTYFPNNPKMPSAGIGSVKSMIGHAMPASGMAGFIKTALALYHGVLPPTLNCNDPHDDMKLTRFEAVQDPIDWSQTDLPMIAGVNAFGFGGSNSHAILERFDNPKKEYSKKHYVHQDETTDTVLYLARSSTQELIQAIESMGTDEGTGTYRIALFNPTETRRKKAIQIIKINKPWKGKQDIWYTSAPLLSTDGKVAFVFPGLDSIGLESLTKGGYNELAKILDLPITSVLENPPVEGVETLSALDESFRLLYAAIRKLGVVPDLVTGHSMGEWAACRAIGLIKTEDIDAMNQKVANGGYTASDCIYITACCAKEKVADVFEDNEEVFFSNDNCPNQVVLSCEKTYVNQLQKILNERHIVNFVLPFSTGYHSPYGAIHEPLVRYHVSNHFDLTRSNIPIWSCITGTPYPKTKEAVTQLHVDFLTQPVQFNQLIQNLYKDGVRMFIQVGTGATIGFINDILKEKDYATVAAGSKDKTVQQQLKRVLAALYIEGRVYDATSLDMVTKYSGTTTKAKPKYKEMKVMLDISSKHVDPARIFTKEDLILPKNLVNPISNTIADVKSLDTPMHELVKGFNTVITELAKSQTEVLEALVNPSAAKFSKVTPPEEDQKTPQVTIAPHSNEERFKRKDFQQEWDLSTQKYPTLLDHVPARRWSKIHDFTDDLEPVIPLAMLIELCYTMITDHVSTHGYVVSKMKNIHIKQFMYAYVDVATTVIAKCKWKTENELHFSIDEYIDIEITIAKSFEPQPKRIPQIQGNKEMPIDKTSDIYNKLYLFHGETYRGIQQMHRFDATGMHTTITAKEGKGSFLDAALQSIALWHVFDKKNLVGFPLGMNEIIFYKDLRKPVGNFEVITQHNHEDEAILQDSLFVKQNNMLCCSIGNVKMIKSEFDFDFFKQIQNQDSELLGEVIAPGIVVMNREYRKVSTWNLLTKSYLEKSEKKQYESLFIGKQIPWFLGRISAKDAIRDYLMTTQQQIGHPSLFTIGNDEKGKPVVQQTETDLPLHISIAHKKDIGVGICSEVPVGIDVEVIEERSTSFTIEMLNPDEVQLFEKHGGGATLLTRMWVAKEAYGKQLGLGLQGHPKQYHITEIQGDDICINGIWIHTIMYTNKYIIGWTI